MNNKGIVWFIPMIIIGLALIGSYKLGGFGGADVGQSCSFLGQPCKYGLECRNEGFLGISSTCQIKEGTGGWDYLLGQYSLNNFVCGGAGLLSPLCNLALPLIAVMVAVALFGVLGWFILGHPFGTYGGVIVGVILGLGLFPFINLYWWIILIVAVALFIILRAIKK